jgi:hypothetical protein
VAEIATAKLKKYKAPGGDKIPPELIKVGGETLMSAIHVFINFSGNNEELPDEWKESIIASIHRKVIKTDSNNCRGV